MRYNEVPNVFVKGIFQYMGREFPMTNKLLDNLLVATYGNKTISPLMTTMLGLNDEEHIPTDDEWATLSDTLKGMFESKWSREEEIFALQYNPDDAYSNNRTTTIDDNRTVENNSSRLEENKEFGFDSEVGSDSSSSNVQSSNKTSNGGEKTITNTTHGNIASSTSKTKQEILTQELEFRKHNYIKCVLKDVIDELTIQYYV